LPADAPNGNGEVLRGADPVNDEIEVGYNARFETRWYRAEWAGRGIMVLYVLAAVLGLLGRGPLSHHTKTTPSRQFALDYEPIARFGTDTQLTFHLADPGGEPGQHQARLFIGNTVEEPLGLTRVLPQPVATIVSKEGETLVFDVPPGETDAQVRIVVEPSQSGLVHATARAGDDRIDWTQIVLP
jgi:hypothetical protein